MRTVEIDEDILESMFEQVEYLHSLVRTISRLLVSKKPDELITTNEAAAILRMSTRHLNNLKAAGKIPFIQIDGRVMYLANDIAKYIIMQTRLFHLTLMLQCATVNQVVICSSYAMAVLISFWIKRLMAFN